MQRWLILSRESKERQNANSTSSANRNGRTGERKRATAEGEGKCRVSMDKPYNLVFTDQIGKHLVRRTVVKHFKKLMSQANLSSSTRFHDLRHSFAVTSLSSGDDIKTVQANLGHASAQFTLDVYGHVTKKMQKDSAERIQLFYEQLQMLDTPEKTQ